MKSPPTWRPPRLTPTGLDFHGLAPRGHLIIGALIREDGGDPLESMWANVSMPVNSRALPVLLAEVLDVGDRCPGVSIGDRVLIQRFSGIAGLDPERLRHLAPELADRFSAIQIVRCDNAVRAQEPGIDKALVATSQVVTWYRDFVRKGQDDLDDKVKAPGEKGIAADAAELDLRVIAARSRMEMAQQNLAIYDRLLQVVLAKRAGRAVNGAIIAAGLQTGDDDAVFDGVLAVVE